MVENMTINYDNEYDQNVVAFRTYGPIIEQLIKQLLKSNDMAVHSVAYRIKTRTSTLRKIGRNPGGREISNLTDLLGLRIITYFRDDVDEIAKMIEREWQWRMA